MFFKIKNKLGRARTGVINTKHGEILTPGFAFVATHGTIKFLDKKEHSLASRIDIPIIYTENNLE